MFSKNSEVISLISPEDLERLSSCFQDLVMKDDQIMEDDQIMPSQKKISQ